MPIGQLIRDLRDLKRWTQVQLAERLAIAAGDPDGAPGRDAVKRWESGKVIPGKYWIGYLSRVLVVPAGLLEAEATLDRVNRRAFLGLSALAVTHGAPAAEMAASIAGRDPGPLAHVQTTHGADIVTASLTDKASIAHLRRWMLDGGVPILRVNAAGILAKVPGQGQADQVVRVLAHDEEVRHLYMTAVTSRVCAVDWTTAGRIASRPTAYAHRADFLATRFAREALNPRDSGARWCSSVMLRELSPMIGRSPA
ncbi:helix-turn-helix domain-containing protein [Streptomyces acidiscabies]|uniref:Helix-turn-helix transcriptional regulator n=1 Tax=Streptomyces acidiscabies TaxID=42234 RepID=A0ABU4MB76_9ACTN|nr:helix-turn-helix transcriptional regulator [Streptomyces acidiscabies]MDX3025376.1 helix-turn-helix transcriptional regulator [Streptomyces acidiscabies]